MKHHLLTLLLALFCSPAFASEPADSLEERDYRFSPKQVIIPTACVALGTWGVDNGFLVKQKTRLQNEVRRHADGHHTTVDNYVQYVPQAMSLFLPAFGVKGRLPYREKLMVSVNANIIMNIVVKGGKMLFDEKRPDSGALNSFPSGHSATVFMGAELVRMEYGGWYGAAAYAMAGFTAAARIWNDRHWANDVLAGAGIGILSARAAYWLLPAEQKWFGWDKSSAKSLSLLPYYSPAAGGHFGATMSLAF